VLNRADLESIWKFCTANRELLARSERGGCFYCEAMFDPAEVEFWVDGRQPETGSTDDGVTALCPRCGIDAVLPSAAPIQLSIEMLGEMHRHYF
jgi:hypothetical protein